MKQEPFILYCLPGSDVPVHATFSRECGSELVFGDVLVRPWPGTSLSGESMTVCPASTPRHVYIESLTRLIQKLKARQGKTVICRNICGCFKSFDPLAMAQRYFSLFPSTFRFLFYHPSTGYWMGASPELLLEVNSANTADTRALAGTMPVEASEQWSLKNLAEHKFVVSDITDRIKAIDTNLEVLADEPRDLVYATVRHLCTPIHISSAKPLPVNDIISALHPTPAVGGFPREDAMADIAVHESHPRNCYGGLITVPAAGGELAYVILRCVHFDEQSWSVYTGSGITADSDAIDEWNETEAKAAPLVQLLNSF